MKIPVLITVLLIAIGAYAQQSTIGGGGSSGGTTPQAGGEIYVATNGSDSAVGSVSAPLATLGRAFSNLNYHGTIILRSGDYTSGIDGTLAGSLKITSYPGEFARLIFGQGLQTNRFTPLSNGIYTATLTQIESNSIAFLTNRWNGNSPIKTTPILLYQTNVAFGPNPAQYPLPPTSTRLTETNRCPVYPFLNTNNIGAMTNLDGYWALNGNKLYIKFAVSNAPGPVWIPGTNATESLIYSLNPGATLEVDGVSVWFGWNGIDMTGANRAVLRRCYVLGSGNVGIMSAGTAAINSIELDDNEVLLSEGFGCDINGMVVNATIDARRMIYVRSTGNSFHDNWREGYACRANVRRICIGDEVSFTGLPERDWISHIGFGFIDDGSTSTFIGCTTVSNTLEGYQLGTSTLAGKRSFQKLQGCVSLGDYAMLSMDDSGSVVHAYNNFIDAQTGAVGMSTVSANYTAKTGGNVLGNNLVNSATVQGNTSGNILIEEYFTTGINTLVAQASLFLNGSVSANFGHPFWLHLGTGTDVYMDSNGMLTVDGGLRMSTNAFTSIATSVAVGGQAIMYNSNSAPLWVASTPFLTSLRATNNLNKGISPP